MFVYPWVYFNQWGDMTINRLGLLQAPACGGPVHESQRGGKWTDLANISDAMICPEMYVHVFFGTIATIPTTIISINIIVAIINIIIVVIIVYMYICMCIYI